MLHGRRPTVPVASMFRAHAERAKALLESPARSPKDDSRHEVDLLKAVAHLADRLDAAMLACQKVRFFVGLN